jgi:hypothetical protein
MRRIIVSVALIMFVMAGPAWAAPLGPIPVSGPSPFTEGCRADPAPTGYEREPSIAVDPLDPDHLVAVWPQDHSRGFVAAVSRDRGATWSRAVVPNMTTCSGDELWPYAIHSRVAIGYDGTVYLSALVQQASCLEPRCLISRVVVARSLDGGVTWETPIEVPTGVDVITHVDPIVVEPDTPGAASLTWTKRSIVGEVSFIARTTDAGRTWASTPIHVSAPGVASFNQLVARHNGDFVDVYIDLSVPHLLDPALPGPGAQVFATTSHDKGQTWSSPVALGEGITATEWPSAAAGPDGTIQAVWRRPLDAGASEIMRTASIDGGMTWSAPVRVRALPPGPVMPPIVSVDQAGSIGVLFDDSRNDIGGDDVATIDVWFMRSLDQGATWTEVHVAGPFDLDEVPGRWLGDFQEMKPLVTGFAAVFALGAPKAIEGPTDIFFARLTNAPLGFASARRPARL